jgi:hypothetical protein
MKLQTQNLRFMLSFVLLTFSTCQETETIPFPITKTLTKGETPVTVTLAGGGYVTSWIVSEETTLGPATAPPFVTAATNVVFANELTTLTVFYRGGEDLPPSVFVMTKAASWTIAIIPYTEPDPSETETEEYPLYTLKQPPPPPTHNPDHAYTTTVRSHH